MKLEHVFEYVGAIFGVVGSIALALNVGVAAWGWAAYLISNAAWIAVAVRKRMYGLLAMQMAYSAISVLGFIRTF